MKEDLFNKKYQLILLGVLRTFFGFIFLWAFFDKLLGLGFSTAKEKAWIMGVSPTLGYLSNLDGTFSYFFNQLSGLFVIDLLFMAGLFGIGVCLTFGIFNKIGNLSGFFFMTFLYLSIIPVKQNPFVDSHFIYFLLFIVFYFIDTTKHFGIKNLWRLKNN